MNSGIKSGMTAGRVGVVAAAAGLACGLMGPLASAQAPEGVTPVFYLESAGLDTILADETDRGLLEALRMLPARVSLLPEETEGEFPEEAATLLGLVGDVFGGGGRVMLTHDADEAGAAFGYGLSVSAALPEGDRRGVGFHERVLGLLEDAPLEVEPLGAAGRRHGFESPIGSVEFGPRRRGASVRYELSAGDGADPSMEIDGLAGEIGLPRGFTPVLRLGFDLRGLTPAARQAVAMAPAELEFLPEILAFSEEIGLVGERGWSVDSVIGRRGGELYAKQVARRFGPFMERFGMPRGGVTPGVMRDIPRDATAAVVGVGDPFLADRMMAEMPLPEEARAVMAAGGFGGLVDLASGLTGVDLREDLFGALGPVSVVYMSESTGGGGWGSGVAMFEVEDAGRLRETEASLREFVTNFLGGAFEEAAPYVAFSPWEHEGTGFVSLRFPGVPVPIQPTYTITDEWVIVTLTPGAAVAAARQASGEGRGLLEAEGVAEALGGREDLAGFGYVNSAATVGQGYALMSSLVSGAANAGLLPGSGAPGPGLLVPTPGELRDGIKPIVQIAYWDGEDIVSELRGNGSLLANAAATFGAIDDAGVLFLPGALAGVGSAMRQQQLEQDGWDMMDFEPEEEEGEDGPTF